MAARLTLNHQHGRKSKIDHDGDHVVVCTLSVFVQLPQKAAKTTYHEVNPFGQASEMFNGLCGKSVGLENVNDLRDSCLRFFKELIRAKPMPRLSLFVRHLTTKSRITVRLPQSTAYTVR